MLYRHVTPIPPLPGNVSDWADIPPAVASDCLNRAQAMRGEISPIGPGMRAVGRARTVHCKAGDNGPLHAALDFAEPGDVFVVDAGGHPNTAIFGGLLARVALRLGVAGLVMDGAIRDRDEIVELGLPVWTRAVVPEGPHKGFGGRIDGPITCGGVPVMPGDLVLGDCDGVTVVPRARIAETLEAARALVAKEARAQEIIASGGNLAELYGVPKIEEIP